MNQSPILLDRRQALTAGIAATSLAAPALATGQRHDPFDADRLAADIERYASFAVHQTGSPGDLKTGQWITERLRSLGYAVSTMPVEVSFFDPHTTLVRSGDLEIPGIPQHPVAPTGAAGITAPLHMRYDAADDISLSGAIAVIPLPYGRHAAVSSPLIGPALQAVRKSGALGAILITTGPSGLPIALNAPEDGTAAAMPILSIGLDKAPPLIARARAGETATLILDGAKGLRNGQNVVARRLAHGPSVVMSTPLSGWFRCAGERGSGIAAWLAFAAWLPQAFPKLNLVLGGMVGHERENLGSRLFIEHAAPAPAQVALWQHFGANFATRDWQEAAPGKLAPLSSADAQRWLIASPALLPGVQHAARGLPGFEHTYPADISTAAGEATTILAHGYNRLIANFGAHRFFHTEQDGPETTSGELVSVTARAMRSAVATILSET